MLTVLSFFAYMTSIVLVVLVSLQTTKSEGLSGAIGGGAQSNVKYLPGSEEILQRYTSWAATAWMVSCLLWYIVSSRHAL